MAEGRNANSRNTKYLEPRPGKTALQMIAAAEDHGLVIPTTTIIWVRTNNTGSAPSSRKMITFFTNSGRKGLFRLYHHSALDADETDDDLNEKVLVEFPTNSEVYTTTFMMENNYEVRLDFALDETGNKISTPTPSTSLPIAGGRGDFRVALKAIIPGRFIARLEADTGAPGVADPIVRVYKDEGVVHAQISIFKNGKLIMIRRISDVADTGLIELRNAYGVRVYSFYDTEKFASPCGPMVPICTGQIAWWIKPNRGTGFITVTDNTDLLQIPNSRDLEKEDDSIWQDPRL